MARSTPKIRPLAIAVICVALVIIAVPSNWKQWAPAIFRPEFHFGLDLAGGTQLDFRISEDELNTQIAEIDKKIADGQGNVNLDELRLQRTVLQQQKDNVVEAIRTVLERRINALGVSEATITPSYIGDEKHLLVECPGVVDVQECIRTVGKTIQLEFKEEFTEATPQYEAEMRARVVSAQAQIRSGQTLEQIGQDLGDELGLAYQPVITLFQNQLPKGLEGVWNLPAGTNVITRDATVKTPVQDANGNTVEEDVRGTFLVQVLKPKTLTGRTINEASVAFKELTKTEPNTTYTFHDKQLLDSNVDSRIITALRSIQQGQLKTVDMGESARIVFLRSLTPGREEVDVSHILVQYKGAQGAAATITRTKEEALARANQLKQQLAGGTNFEELARTQSDGPSSQNAGKLGVITRGSLVPAFEAVAFSAKQGVISDPVETPFGYHLIRANKAATTSADTATFDEFVINGDAAKSRAESILAKMQSGNVKTQEEAITLRTLFFSFKPTGWKDTNLDGKHFQSASVRLDTTTNVPLVQILFDAEGGKLFQEMTKRNVGKRIAIFVGGQLVSAPTVQQEITGGTAVITGSQNVEEARSLAQDLNTGAIPAPIHLAGQRTVEATLGAEALNTSVNAALVGIVILMLYMVFMYRALGVLANIGLVAYAIGFLALMKMPLFLVSNTYVVLTLAGAAGLILSIGMAVDTNVLVFERVKEELRKGKHLKSAVETGFEKAWPSIRDSNVSTLITCGLLFLIGTSIVRGFALTLAIGVIISMFTGMVLSRALARKVAETSFAEKRSWFVKG